MKPEITVDEDTAAPAMRVLKSGKTSSLSGRSTIGYAVGCNQAKAILFRITSNSGAGMFAKDWVSMGDISALLAKVPKITSSSVQELYAGKSANTAGFLLAVLQCEGLLESSAGDQRSYLCKDPKPFLTRVAGLIDAGVALPDEEGAGEQLPDVSVPVPVAPKRGRPKKA
jgi:hypothetical protein